MLFFSGIEHLIRPRQLRFAMSNSAVMDDGRKYSCSACAVSSCLACKCLAWLLMFPPADLRHVACGRGFPSTAKVLFHERRTADTVALGQRAAVPSDQSRRNGVMLPQR